MPTRNLEWLDSINHFLKLIYRLKYYFKTKSDDVKLFLTPFKIGLSGYYQWVIQFASGFKSAGISTFRRLNKNIATGRNASNNLQKFFSI
jgi:hypothetical protein